jgi:hypothetical protein
LLTGSSVAETGDTDLARALGPLVDALVPSSVPAHRRERRRGRFRP